jgi:hypothetical protein
MVFEVGNTAGLRHGLSKLPEYQCWADMRTRCLNPDHRYFADYGGRGITVCDRWSRFEEFLADIGRRPTPEHTLDRYPNNDGNYEPGNVRWASRKEQIDNRRNTRFVMIDGEKRPLSDVIRERGLNRRLVCSRIERGWSPEKAVSTPAAWNRPDLSNKGKQR